MRFIFKSSHKPSKYLFPVVVRDIKAESHANQLCRNSSDVGYMYEVGPRLVKESQANISSISSISTYYKIISNFIFKALKMLVFIQFVIAVRVTCTLLQCNLNLHL